MSKKSENGANVQGTSNTATNAKANDNAMVQQFGDAGQTLKSLEDLQKQLKEAKEALKEAKAKQAKEAKKPRYTRGHALLEALQAGGNREQIVEAIDQFYKKHGGQANVSGAKTMVDLHLPILRLAGVVKEDKNGVNWQGKAIDFSQIEFKE